MTQGCIEQYASMAFDASEQIEYFEKGKLYAVQIESENSCMQGCIYCYAKAIPQTKNHLTSEEIRGIIDDSKDLEVRMIDWLGGDPLMRDDWYELMKCALSKGLSNNIWTSGYPLANEEIAKKAMEVSKGGFISVHLDSLDDEIYSKLHRGDAKRMKKAILKGVDNVLNLGKSPEKMVNCITYTKLQATEDVRKTIRWFWEKKGLRTVLTLFNPIGFGESHPELEPSMEEIRVAYEYRNQLNYSETLGTMDVSKYYCGGMLCITFKGDVTPCSVIRRSYGNLREEPFKKIYERHKERLLWIRLRKRENLEGFCSSCEHNSVCWGCRSSAYYYTGDDFAADPKCWLNPENLK